MVAHSSDKGHQTALYVDISASECVCLPMHNDIGSINPYGDDLSSARLLFSYLSRAVKQTCGLMC